VQVASKPIYLYAYPPCLRLTPPLPSDLDCPVTCPTAAHATAHPARDRFDRVPQNSALLSQHLTARPPLRTLCRTINPLSLYLFLSPSRSVAHGRPLDNRQNSLQTQTPHLAPRSGRRTLQTSTQQLIQHRGPPKHLQPARRLPRPRRLDHITREW
jgi:hypothetical protein